MSARVGWIVRIKGDRPGRCNDDRCHFPLAILLLIANQSFQHGNKVRQRLARPGNGLSLALAHLHPEASTHLDNAVLVLDRPGDGTGLDGGHVGESHVVNHIQATASAWTADKPPSSTPTLTSKDSAAG